MMWSKLALSIFAGLMISSAAYADKAEKLDYNSQDPNLALDENPSHTAGQGGSQAFHDGQKTDKLPNVSCNCANPGIRSNTNPSRSSGTTNSPGSPDGTQ